HSQTKHLFKRYFPLWRVENCCNPAGTITGCYEPFLHCDYKLTSQSRCPIYDIPNDFVSVSLAANFMGSKATVRIRQTGPNSCVIDNSCTYPSDLSRFPITARSTALKGRFECSRFVPYYTRSQINGGALNGKTPILGYADEPVELFFMHIQGSG
ncbi:MltA domain-containing protein, partial [Neisseria sp. P0020.S005]|uniref:MltA domain-containing protein n=1 Tax=Neisseria sp. P0020.S005 TaxID=3436810 RepID=UPI003F821309